MLTKLTKYKKLFLLVIPSLSLRCSFLYYIEYKTDFDELFTD